MNVVLTSFIIIYDDFVNVFYILLIKILYIINARRKIGFYISKYNIQSLPSYIYFVIKLFSILLTIMYIYNKKNLSLKYNSIKMFV